MSFEEFIMRMEIEYELINQESVIKIDMPKEETLLTLFATMRVVRDYIEDEVEGFEIGQELDSGDEYVDGFEDFMGRMGY